MANSHTARDLRHSSTRMVTRLRSSFALGFAAAPPAWGQANDREIHSLMHGEVLA
jgi:hypothetical protein